MSYINQFLFSVSLLFLLCSFFTCAAITISLTVHLFFFVTTAHLLKSLTLSFRWKCDSLKYRFAIFLLKQAPPSFFANKRTLFGQHTSEQARCNWVWLLWNSLSFSFHSSSFFCFGNWASSSSEFIQLDTATISRVHGSIIAIIGYGQSAWSIWFGSVSLFSIFVELRPA